MDEDPSDGVRSGVSHRNYAGTPPERANEEQQIAVNLMTTTEKNNMSCITEEERSSEDDESTQKQEISQEQWPVNSNPVLSIPYLTTPAYKPYTLVLDLDETLIHYLDIDYQ